MLIDWFTVGAQTLNFLILVWLMKRFLYKPVISAIDEREKRIATELANADKKKEEAQKESDDFKHKNELFDQQRAALLSKATDEAKTERQRLFDEARQATDALSAKRQETMKNDARTLNQAIRHRTEQEVFAIARKALTDLAGTGLEVSMVDLFVNRLRALQGVEKEQLTSAIKASHTPVIVRTTSDLTLALTASTESAIKETFGKGIQVHFETSPEMIRGIELTTDGHKVSWSIADYLTSMENGINELLSERDKPIPEPKPEPEQKPKPKLKLKPKPKPKPKSKHETKSQ
jgi:F-type H+-transporting ATPase subunit b